MSDLEDSTIETPQNSESEDEEQTPVQVQQVLDYHQFLTQGRSLF